MPVTLAQRAAIEDVIQALLSLKSPRIKRQLATIFLEFPDRVMYPHYYEVIPEPRCINHIRASVEKNRYKDPLDAYTDLSLVFWNALYYNEPGSQIASDAEVLKTALEKEWKRRVETLPAPLRSSPPPSAPQKVHPPADTHQAERSKPAAAVAPSPVSSMSTTAAALGRAATTTAGTVQRLAEGEAPVPATTTTRRTRTDFERRETTPEAIIDAPAMGSVAAGVSSSGEAVDGDVSSSWAKDGEGDEIVRQLEKGVPKWEGFGDKGWMSDGSAERYQEIVRDIKGYKDVIGNRLALALETVPEESSNPILSYSTPLSLKIIDQRTRSKYYTIPSDFDKDMARLFEKARRHHPPATEAYGHVLLLQRLCQALTSPSPPAGPPFSSTTNFASVRAGPGYARPLSTAILDPDAAGVTTFRVSSKDRTFVDEVWYKGWSVKLADWLHLSNPDDPSRPIVGHVFRVWVSEETAKKGQPGVTTCWYFRPEQTFHPSNRQFWKGEVFKTSHFADHPVEDILEKIACQFTARHIRGRPRPPYWYPGWPLYMCDSRYNDRERVFVKIKNWNSCVPEEVRKSEEFMPIYLFERSVFPKKGPSPFLGKGALKGPGGIDETVGKEESEKDRERDVAVGSGGTSARDRRKTSRRAAGGGTGGEGLVKGDVPWNPATPSATATPYYYASSQLALQQYALQNRTQPDPTDRSVLAAAGGPAALGQNPHMENLSPEIAKHFDRDPETKEVLWFGAAPINAARPSAPKHSLAYLHFLASKRKRDAAANEDAMDVDVDETSIVGDDGRLKRTKGPVLTTMSESLKEVALRFGGGRIE